MKHLLIILALVTSAFSYSFSILPPMTKKGDFAVNPVFFSDDKNSGGMEMFMYYGLTDKVDFCSSILTYNGASNFSTMVRYDLGQARNLGVRMNTSWVTPQANMTLENDKMFLQGTIATQFTYDYAEKPAFYALICPGLKFKNMDFFCEIDPGYYLMDGDFANCFVRPEGFNLDIVPGIGFNIGDTFLSFAAPIYNLKTEAVVTVGAWIYYTIKK